MAVPRIIHQTWKSRELHPAVRSCVESFRFFNDAWDHRFYTDDDCIAWIKRRCPELLSSYLSFPKGIHRADLFRILVLYFDGGVYADLDVECMIPLDEMLARLDSRKSAFFVRDHPVHERIHFSGRAMYMNDFMIAEPGSAFVGQILKWMLRCPPDSKNPTDAVMQTGPGVISSVIEMLGGPEQISELEIIPTHWVHPLPDLNCSFAEHAFYFKSIQAREWRTDDVCVAHYWYHSWVTPRNMLVEHSRVLLQSLGERVERKLRWICGLDVNDFDYVICCALAEFAEQGGTVLFETHEGASSLQERFLTLMKAVGLKPPMGWFTREEKPTVKQVSELEKIGAVCFETKLAKAVHPLTQKKLIIANPDNELDLQHLAERGLAFEGLVLGPRVPDGKLIGEEAGIHLTEVASTSMRIPRVVHIMPFQETNGASVEAIAESLAEIEFSIRRWDRTQLEELIANATLGVHELSFLSDSEFQLMAALAVLSSFGGVIYSGNSSWPFEELRTARQAIYFSDDNGWLIAVAPGSGVINGAVRQWMIDGPKGKEANPKEFFTGRIAGLMDLAGLDNFEALNGGSEFLRG